jgi:hypothetical protein
VKLIYCRFHQEIMESIYDCPCIIFRKWQNLHRQKERNWVIQNAWNQALCSKTRKLSALRNSPKHHYGTSRELLSRIDHGMTRKTLPFRLHLAWYWFLTPIPQQHFCFLEKLVPTSYSKLSRWSRVALPCAWKNTNDERFQCCRVQQMVSNDVAVDGESVSIDPDIRRRDWGPLKFPALISPHRPKLPRRTFNAVTSRQRGKLEKTIK